MNRKYFSSHGVTLIELIVSIVIISIAVGGIMALFLGTSSSSADPMIRAQSLAIAQSYMDEIMMQAYTTDGATAGRSNYNDVDDYNAITAGSSIADQFGNSISALSAYTIGVQVSACNPATCGSELNSVNAKKISVIVTHIGLGTDVPLIAYRADY